MTQRTKDTSSRGTAVVRVELVRYVKVPMSWEAHQSPGIEGTAEEAVREDMKAELKALVYGPDLDITAIDFVEWQNLEGEDAR